MRAIRASYPMQVLLILAYTSTEDWFIAELLVKDKVNPSNSRFQKMEIRFSAFFNFPAPLLYLIRDGSNKSPMILTSFRENLVSLWIDQGLLTVGWAK